MRPSEPIAPPLWPVPGFGGLLCGVVLVAAWLRIQFCYAGLPYLHVWDEPQTASTALGMLRSGDFNPHFFHYGSLMIYVSLLVDIVHALSLLGMSPRSPEALTSVGGIVINADTQWHWTISHPSFYFWNRVVVAGMGAGTVALVGWIGRWIAGPVAGLTAAVLLAGASVHIRESAVIMNDAPLTFFVLAAALGAIAFLESAKPAGLVLSLVSVGLAMGCKYTGGIGLILPWTAVAIAASRGTASFPGWVWPALLLLPGGTFLLTTPYAILDLPDFLNQVGYELRHYKVLGHGTSTVTPGWPNLKLQLGELYACLGPIPCALAAAGLLTLGRRHGWVVWMFPVVYGAYMSNTRINFTRNFLVLYPFVLLSAGCALAAAFNWVEGRRRTIAAGVLATASLGWLGMAVPDARAARRPETRTQMADQLASERWTRIGVPTEVRMHGFDLWRMRKKDVREAPLHELLCASDREVVVVPVRFLSIEDPLEAAALNALLPPEDAALVHGAAGKGELWIERYTDHPQLRVVPQEPPDGACDSVSIRANQLINDRGFDVTAHTLFATSAGEITSPSRALAAGRWTATWVLRGHPAGDELPRVALAGHVGDATLVAAEVSLPDAWTTQIFAFELQEPGDVVLSADFLNDAVVGGKDRNIEVAGMLLAPEAATAAP